MSGHLRYIHKGEDVRNLRGVLNAIIRRVMMLPDDRVPIGDSVTFRWAKLDEEMAVGDSATASLWGEDGESWDADTGENVTVYAPPVQASAIALDTWIRIYQIPDGTKWIVDLAACPEE